jgi:hypothetical protein
VLFDLSVAFLATLAVYVLPYDVALVVGVTAYGALSIWERRRNRVTPVTLTLFVCYLALGVLRLGGVTSGWEAYTGVMIYAALAVMAVSLLAAGMPFTLFYSQGKGMRSLHTTVSAMWSVIYTASAVLSVVLMPDVSFILLPLGLLIAGIVFSVVLNYYTFGRRHRRKDRFEIGAYTFRRADGDDELISAFYDLASVSIWETIQRSPARTIRSREELRRTMTDSDAPYEGRIARFLALEGTSPFATIFCVLDGPKGLPFERDTGVELSALRRHGRLMEIGHFTIDPRRRLKPSVFTGLFKAAVDFALDEDVVFIANCSYTSSAGMYEKIGFRPFLESPIPDVVLGADVTPMLLNLSRMVVYSEDETGDPGVGAVRDALETYVAERYYKRRLFINAWRRSKNYDLSPGSALFGSEVL